MLTGMPSGYNAVLTTVQRNMKDVGDLAGHASDTSYIRYLIPVHLFLRQLSFNLTATLSRANQCTCQIFTIHVKFRHEHFKFTP